MEKEFEIEKVEPVNPNDQRGPTYEWKFLDGGQITISERKKESKFGGHFHLGEDPSKNPERLFVAQGKIKVRLITEDPITIYVAILEAGNTLTIGPKVKHEMEALEDSLIIEARKTHFDKDRSDTYTYT